MPKLAPAVLTLWLAAAALSAQTPRAGWEIDTSQARLAQRPELVSSPPLLYPPAMRQARIEGRVVIRAIIDTTGRIEPASVKIVQTPNPGFDQAVHFYVLHAIFRPARVHGRAVRVLVNIPIDFKIPPGEVRSMLEPSSPPE